VPPLYAARGWTRPLLTLTVTVGLCLSLASGALVACNTKTSAVRNTNVGSRYGQVEGLVNHGTWYITKTRYRRTIDKVVYNGEDVSSKPPLLPTVTAGVYWVYRAVTGYDIRTDEHKVVRFCNWVMGAFLHTLMLLYWLRFLLLISARPDAVILALATVAFGFLGAGYAIELNNHSVAACMTTVAFYYAFRLRNGFEPRWWHWTVSGALSGLLPAVDVPSALTSAGIFLYLLSWDWKETLKRWVPLAIWGPLIAMWLNLQITDSIYPVQMQPELKKGTYWANPKGVDALNEPKRIYAFNVLVGHHGIFTMTPVLIAGLAYLVRSLRSATWRASGLWRAETLLFAVTTTLLITFYIVRTRNYGGNCVGFRWAIAFTPLLFGLVAFWLTQTEVRLKHAIGVCAATGVTMFHVTQCFWTPWHVSAWERFVKMVVPAWIGG
jgi:hypothetical protein